ncbi:carboxymuconolactone decarboxylase family protein [Paraburkholderia phytofirmans]|uniref:Carboxymuconolactone decarboxylase family protein n=1 Tax=Paraburkholderia phytofirmans TaxID=261302 RepID=A0ABW9BAX0_9BURK
MNIDSLERALASGAEPLKLQKLIALGIAIALREDTCIAHHVVRALRAGATSSELSDAVNVAAAIGGGPMASYDRRLRQATRQIEAGEYPLEPAVPVAARS